MNEDNYVCIQKMYNHVIPDIHISYGKTSFSMYGGLQYNFDMPIVYDLNREDIEQVELYYNNLQLKYNEDLKDLAKVRNTYVIDTNNPTFIIDKNKKPVKSNNNIFENNFNIKFMDTFDISIFHYIISNIKQNRLVIKFNSCLSPLLPQIIYIYSSIFEKSYLCKSKKDNRLKDSFLFIGTDPNREDILILQDKLKQYKSNKSQIKSLLSENDIVSMDENSDYNKYIENIYYPFINQLKIDNYILLNILKKSITNQNKSINNIWQDKLREVLNDKSI